LTKHGRSCRGRFSPAPLFSLAQFIAYFFGVFAVSIRHRSLFYDFRGSQAPPAVASRMGDWCSLTVQTAGTPYVKAVSGGSMDLLLDATNEVQSACLYQGDVLPFDIDEIRRVSFVVKLTATLNAAIMGAFGVCSARNATLDTVAEAAWFHFNGSNALVVETDDGTNNNDDVATGIDLSTTYKRCTIDFCTGVKTNSPPTASKGGKGNVLFYVSDSMSSQRRVATGTAFDMSNYAGNLQLFAQIQKTAAAAGATLSIQEIEVEFKTGA
jgi:hypothetical protein